MVFADYNNDGLLSAGEPSTRTLLDGSFSLNSIDPTANLVSISDSQTVDTFTGENVSGVKLKARILALLKNPWKSNYSMKKKFLGMKSHFQWLRSH